MHILRHLRVWELTALKSECNSIFLICSLVFDDRLTVIYKAVSNFLESQSNYIGNYKKIPMHFQIGKIYLP